MPGERDALQVDVLLIVDMQAGIRQGSPKHNLNSVVAHIQSLAADVRNRGGRVCFIQHDGESDDDFAPHSPSWRILTELEPQADDPVFRKRLNSGFVGTSLGSDLRRLDPARVLVTGWATDLCVDATVRSAVERGLPVVVVEDAHTVADRPQLTAQQVIDHHHWIWLNLFSKTPVRIETTASILSR